MAPSPSHSGGQESRPGRERTKAGRAEDEREEVALRRSEQRLQFALEGANEGIWDEDLRTNSVFLSARGCEMLGYRPEEFHQDVSSWNLMVHPDDLPAMQAALAEHLSGRAPGLQIEQRLKTKSGEYKWILTRGKVSEWDATGRAARITGTHTDITERKQTEAALRHSREQLRALLARLERLREEERTAIAREVHDVLGQLLTGLKMDLSWWERRFDQITDEPLRRALEDKVAATSRLTDMMVETVQKISRELRPSVLDNLGLGAALQFEARQFQERSGIACEVSVPSEAVSLAPDRATGVFRVFQDLLTNVARHAQATRLTVTLSQTAENVGLEVKDNGRGIRDAQLSDPKSLGLLGMAERASLMGGQFEIHGTAGGGTTATLTIPAQRR